MQKNRKNIKVKYTRKSIALCSIFIALFVCVLSLSNFDSTKSFSATVNTYGSAMIADSYNDVIFDGVIAKGTDITKSADVTYKSSKYSGNNTSAKSNIYLMCPKVAYYYDASGTKKWIDAKIFPYGKTKSDGWVILKSGNSTNGWNLQFSFTGSNATRTASCKYQFFESGTTTRININLIMTYGTGRTNHAIEVNRELKKIFFDSTRNLTYINGGKPYNDNIVGTGYNPKGTSSGSVGEGNTYVYQSTGFGDGLDSDHIYVMVPSSLDLITQFVYWSPDVNGWDAGIFNATDPQGTTGHRKVADDSTVKYHITNSKSDATVWKTITTRKLRYSNAAASDFVDITKVSPKKGYKLSSQWTTNANGTGTTLPTSFTNSGYNLYAYLSPITYTVSYNGNGSTGGSTASSSHKYDTAKPLTANKFTRAYTVTYNKNGGTCADSATATYTFAGWATSSSATTAKYADNASVTNLSSTDGATVTLYAVWTKKSVTLPTPTKTGCTFKGWYTDSGCTTLAGNAGAAYTPTKNITLYAKWEANPYTLTFDKNGGTQTESQRTVKYGAQFGSLPTPTKTGYSFDAWYNETGLTSEVSATTTMPASDKTIYAGYSPITYSVKYDGNGYTGGTMSNSSHTYDAAKKLSKNTYTRSYTVTYDNDNGSCTPDKNSDVATYDFKGWALTNTATTKSYSDEQSVTNLANESGKTITLYAVWQPQGVVLPNATSGEDIFEGWYLNEEKTQFAGKAGDTYIPKANVTLYPNFGPGKYFVSFVDTDGITKLFDDEAYGIEGEPYGTRLYCGENIPSKEGYLFAGWYDISDTTYSNLVLMTDIVTRNTTLRARWFKVTFSNTSVTYNGSQQAPVITIEDDQHNTLPSERYTVTCPSDMTGVGTREIKVEGIINQMCCGEVTSTFTINKKVLTDTDIIITNYSESNPIIKEYDGTNSTEVLANNIDLAYASDTSIKIGFDYALYEDGIPNNTVKKDVMLYNLTPPNSNYELAISDKTFTDYGMIKDTKAPKISKVEISSEPVIYGLGQTIELRITLSEEVTGTVNSSYTIDLLKPNSTDKFAEGIPLVFNSESKNEFTCEYTVKESDNGIDGIIGCVINKAGVDAYKDAFNLELDTSVSNEAKSFIKSIKIITDRFNVPVSVSPNAEETSENIIRFTFDLSDVDFEDDYDLDLLTDPVVTKVLGEELIINDDESGIVNITKDKIHKKVVVTIDTTNEITPDNRDGITYKVRYEEDSITNKFNNGNNEVSKEIKVVRNLNHEDIVVTYKGASISHNGSSVLAEKDDTFTISIKPSSSAAGGTITYSDGVADEVHDTTNTITDEKKTFENIVVSKEGWANSLPFGINFVFEEIPEEPDDGPDGPGGGEDPDGPGGGGDTPGGNDNPKPNNNGGGNKGSSTTITIGGTSDSYLGYKPGQNHFAYMEGFKNNTFKPDGKLTRAEMCAVLARINSEYDDSIDYSSSITFKDEKNNTKAWYRNYLGFAVKNKLVEGYPNGTYKASGNITRAEFVTVISKAFSINTNYSSHIFSDAKNKWYEKYVNNLAYYGYVEGRNDKKFHGNDYITRAEACKIINAVLNRDLRTKNTLSDSLRERFTRTFKDVSSNKWYYYDIIEATMNY